MTNHGAATWADTVLLKLGKFGLIELRILALRMPKDASQCGDIFCFDSRKYVVITRIISRVMGVGGRNNVYPLKPPKWVFLQDVECLRSDIIR